MAGFGRQAAVVVGGNGNASRTADDAVKVDASWLSASSPHQASRRSRQRPAWDVGDASGVRFLGRLFQFLVDVFCGRLWFFTRRATFWLRSLVGLGDRYLVALGRERMLHVLAQGERVDVPGAIGGVVKFDLRNLRLKLAVGEKVKIVSLPDPRRD